MCRSHCSTEKSAKVSTSNRDALLTSRDCSRDNHRRRARVGEIGGDDRRGVTLGDQLGGERIGLCGRRMAMDDDVPGIGGERPNQRRPDPLGPTGNDGDRRADGRGCGWEHIVA